MSEVPSEIICATATLDAGSKWLKKRMMPRIKSMGLELRDSSHLDTRRSGDKIYSKTFDGGTLDVASAQSASQLASETKRIVVCEEVDRWVENLKNEGNPFDIVKKRAQAWHNLKKIYVSSTPTIEGYSKIAELYEEGDMRQYWVPCPECNKRQLLKIDSGDTGGITWSTSSGRIRNNEVYYVCEHCGACIQETKKPYMLRGGIWVPQKEPEFDHIASFHLSALYSPLMTWLQVAQEFIKSHSSPLAAQNFRNLVQGLTYKETGLRVSMEKAIEHRGSYKSCEPPDEVLFITGGADVQQGKQIYSTYSDKQIDNTVAQMMSEGKDPWKASLPRLEIEMLGTGLDLKTWSIEYKVFYGHTNDPSSGAWAKMLKWIEDSQLKYRRMDGTFVPVKRIFIDSGDGLRTQAVYEFCMRYPFLVPVKGFQALKKDKKRGDEMSVKSFTRFTAKMQAGQKCVDVSTNYYKRVIYDSLRVPRSQEADQRAKFPDHPRDYPDHYFEMLTAEEQRKDLSFHKAKNRNNEALDCKVYAWCAADEFLESVVNTARAKMVLAGKTKTYAEERYTVRAVIGAMHQARLREMKDAIDDKR